MRNAPLCLGILLLAGCLSPAAPAARAPGGVPDASESPSLRADFACLDSFAYGKPCDQVTEFPGDGPDLVAVAVQPGSPNHVALAFTTENPEGAYLFAFNAPGRGAVPVTVSWVELTDDGGLSWSWLQAPAFTTPEPATALGREAEYFGDVAFDANGTLYVSGSYTKAYEQTYNAVDGNVVPQQSSADPYVFAASSNNGGKSWTQSALLGQSPRARLSSLALPPSGALVYWTDEDRKLAFARLDEPTAIYHGSSCEAPESSAVQGSVAYLPCLELDPGRVVVSAVQADLSFAEAGAKTLPPGGSSERFDIHLLANRSRLILINNRDSLDVDEPLYAVSRDGGANWTSWRPLNDDCQPCSSSADGPTEAQGAALDAEGRLHVLLWSNPSQGTTNLVQTRDVYVLRILRPEDGALLSETVVFDQPRDQKPSAFLWGTMNGLAVDGQHGFYGVQLPEGGYVTGKYRW